MKRLMVLGSIVVLVMGMVAIGQAKPRIYKWVKDKRVSSDDVLTKIQFSRVVSISEKQAEKIAGEVMTENLYLSLAKYHVTKHQQDGETTGDSVLPEELIGQRTVELADEDFRFILEVKTKRIGNRTRITAKAWPVYRLRDAEAEEARDDETTGENSVEVKIKSDRSGAIVMGPIMIAPVLGLPSDYGITPLADAGERAAEIVKAFMYFLDVRMKEMKQDVVSSEPAPVAKPEVVEQSAGVTESSASEEGAGSEISIKVKSKK